MSVIFFVVSGENPTLPFSEIESIFQAEGLKFRILMGQRQLSRIETRNENVKHVMMRSSMTRICGLEIFNCRAKEDEIIKHVLENNVASFAERTESFAVRVLRLNADSMHINGWQLEKRIGETILENSKDRKVDLTKPDKFFLGILTGNTFFFGLKIASVRAKDFIERGPKKKVFFHPTAMPAKLARCMVNLARPRKGDYLLDPFCGSGSILVEAGMIGCRVIGMDIKRRLTIGCLSNLEQFNIRSAKIVVADARHCPLKDVMLDCVVSDLPYGISSTTLGLDPVDLYEGFFSHIIDHVKIGKRLCLAAPKTANIKRIACNFGLKYIESHYMHVHHNLTREISVLER